VRAILRNREVEVEAEVEAVAMEMEMEAVEMEAEVEAMEMEVVMAVENLQLSSFSIMESHEYAMSSKMMNPNIMKDAFRVVSIHSQWPLTKHS
jgi:hypothetical protein